MKDEELAKESNQDENYNKINDYFQQESKVIMEEMKQW
eukprot:CAMPEP_0176349994 /NCGR_PEP_ID=MMETSP0126-20121128/9117_1 /TAXON_ID=141414 ORGANISM="Strombidinopsis acuminatum, Strain SPMC142" /NCGR_SAMPLE_ID=MMETSP0126 /ASSEMBLY_ACC=CAM_ASM_000229 /LENGTH=37 /DNA_ID= /DNA_START= /DNA_END= /DNA_ORIENTATION=